jgi:RNA polymerase sigma factor (sigma-70 family)
VPHHEGKLCANVAHFAVADAECSVKGEIMTTRPPVPPFTHETAVQKVRLAEDGWNSRDPEKVSLVYTVDSRWRNRSEFINGRAEIVAFRASLEIATDSNDDFGADGLRYEITDQGPNPETRYAQSEEKNILMKAIQSLRPTLRVAIQVQQLQERSLRETAEAIGISLTAVKGRLFHARNVLRRSMIPKLIHQPRFAHQIRGLPAGQWLTKNIAGLNGKNSLAEKEPPQGMAQPLRFRGAEFPRHSWPGANVRTRFDNQQQSNDKEQGDQYVVDTKGKRHHRAPSNLHPGGADWRSFSKEIGA